MQGFGHQLVSILIKTLRSFLEPVDGCLRDLLETDQIGIDAEDPLGGGVRLLKRIHHLDQPEYRMQYWLGAPGAAPSAHPFSNSRPLMASSFVCASSPAAKACAGQTRHSITAIVIRMFI